MLSESPSPAPLRLPSPAPLRLPSPAPASDSSDYSSESDYYVASVKKQKVNEEDVESSDFKSLDALSLSDGSCTEGEEEDDHTDDGYFRPTFPGEKLGDLACWKKYFDQIYDSEGFDIKDYPGSGPLTSVFPMRYYLDFPEHVGMLKGYAAKALEQYNEKYGTKYVVKDLLKVNGDGCKDFIFYLTLTVENGEKEEYFQVKVVRHLDQSLDFPIVRPRVKGGVDI